MQYDSTLVLWVDFTSCKKLSLEFQYLGYIESLCPSCTNHPVRELSQIGKEMDKQGKITSLMSFTFSRSLRESGRQPHSCLKFSIWTRVLQSSYVSIFWQCLVSFSSPRKESVTVTSFKLFRLYWPSPTSPTGSKE